MRPTGLKTILLAATVYKKKKRKKEDIELQLLFSLFCKVLLVKDRIYLFYQSIILHSNSIRKFLATENLPV